ALKALEHQYGTLSDTVSVRTGGGGRHFYFKHPGKPITNCVGRLGPGLDIRGDGGYVVGPPSIHASGKPYEWGAIGLADADPAPLPKWLLERLSDAETTTAPTADEPIIRGRRNPVLTSLAGTMRRRGMTEEAIRSALLAENKARCIPPLHKDEVLEIAASVARYTPQPTDDVHLTDLGNARRLVASHGNDLRYCAAWHTWLVWDGKRWAKD